MDAWAKQMRGKVLAERCTLCALCCSNAWAATCTLCAVIHGHFSLVISPLKRYILP
jgi:hypothetical protein